MKNTWCEFDKIKPKPDKLFLITNRRFVEIAYYEDGELLKPWRYNKNDKPILSVKQAGLMWKYINLPD